MPIDLTNSWNPFCAKFLLFFRCRRRSSRYCLWWDPGACNRSLMEKAWRRRIRHFPLSTFWFLDYDFVVVDFSAIYRLSEDLVYMTTYHKLIIVLQFADHERKSKYLTIAGHRTHPVYMTTLTFNQELHPNLQVGFITCNFFFYNLKRAVIKVSRTD